MRIRPGVQLASMSDIGCQRENNEDQYAYWEPVADEEFARKGRLAIVADGMGGTKAARRPAASRSKPSRKSLPKLLTGIYAPYCS